MAGDRITEEKIVDKKVYSIGEKYAKGLQPAIDANEKWLQTFAPIKDAALEYAKIEGQFKVSDGRKEFLSIKQQEEVLRKKTADAIRAEQTALVSKQKVEQSIIDTEKKGLQLTTQKNRAQQKTIKLTEQEKLELRILNRGLREAAVISSKLSTEYEKQSVRLIQLRRRYKDLALTQGTSGKEAKKLRNDIIKLDSALKGVDANVGQFQRNVGNYTKAMNNARAAARSLASAMGLVGGAFLVVRVVKDAIKVLKDFEKSNATLSAILQVEREDMQGLTDDSIRLGATTVKTASQVTELQIAYARLGFAQREILELTESTISGSIAMNAELDRTANLVGAVVNTFDDFSTIDAPEIIDILALSTAKSALNFEKLEKGIPIVAGAANAAGVPFTRLVALMGKLSDSGIDVSTSSTAIRNIFIKSKEAGEDYAQIIERIKGSQEKLTASVDAFGVRAAVSASVLSQNIDATNELDEALNNAAGTAERMAAKELNTLEGSLKLLRSAWEGYLLKLDEASGTTQTLKGFIAGLATNLESIIKYIVLGTKAWVAYKIAIQSAKLQTSLMNKQLALTRLNTIKGAKGINIATLSWKRFNTALKANALFLVVAGIVGLISVLNKLNKSLGETVTETNEATTSFLEARDAQEKHSESVKTLVDRYDELTEKAKELGGKTKLNVKEQKELDTIIKQLAKDFPLTVTEVDKYGKAIKISTDKVREHNKARNEGFFGSQKETTLLEENRAELELLEKQQEKYNNVLKEGTGFYVEGIGRVAVYNGVLKKQEVISGKNSDTLKEGNALTSQQIDIVEAAINKNEELITTKKEFITILTAEGRAQIEAKKKAEEEAEAKRKLEAANAKAIEDAEALANLKGDEALKVSELKVKINELKKEQDGLSLSDKKRADDIKSLIGVYQKQINQILGITKANKSAEKAAKEQAAAEKKSLNDAFKLKSFGLKQRINEQKEIANNDKTSFEDRKIAIEDQSDFEIELAFITAKNKFDSTKEFTDKEIEALLTKSKVSKSVLQKLTDEELLIIKEFQAQKDEIQDQKEDSDEGLDIAILIFNANRQKEIREQALNDELRLEEEAFQKELALNADRESAIEAHEKRVADIRIKYAKEDVKVHIAALEQLIESSEEGSKARIAAETKLAKAKLELSKLTTDGILVNDKKEVLSTKEKVELILEITGELVSALTDLANAIFERRIQKIDEEIAREDERFEHLLANENLSEEDRKRIEQEQEASRKILEKKKAKEQTKAAKANKAAALAQAAISTALAILSALQTQPFLPLGPAMAILAGVLGSIQIAAIAATPIPKFAIGTRDAPQGWAEVDELGPEIHTDKHGKIKSLGSKKGANLRYLEKGDQIYPHRSHDDYKRLMSASILTSVETNNRKLNDFQANQIFNINNDALLTEQQLTRKSIEKLKHTVVVNQQKVDFEHELFRLKNIN